MDSDFGRPSLEQVYAFRSIELAGTTSVDGVATGRAMTRAAMSDPAWGTGAIGLMSIGVPGGDAWLTSKWHVWWELPMRWRDDHTSIFSGSVVTIVQPDVAMQYASQTQTLYTTERLSGSDSRPRVTAPKGTCIPSLDHRIEGVRVIRPGLPDSDWQFDTLGLEPYLGRSARRVRATRRPGSPTHGFRVSGFWMGVDEYECVIDDQLQILLSVTAIVDGAAAATISVEHVSVDQPIPASTFDFSPPAGTRIAQVGDKTRK
jgi:hypothetical protein